MAARLLTYQCCKRTCLDGKKQALDSLMGSLSRMTKHERRCAMLSGLALCEVFSMDPKATAKGDMRQRKRFDYMLPYVGKVCKEAYMACFDISHRHLVQSHKKVELRDISVRPHGNLKNRHTAVHDQDAIVQWFRGVASDVGEAVLLRVRLKKKIGDRVVRYYGCEDNTLLSASFTWEQLLGEYKNFVDDPLASIPSVTAFTGILNSRCPTCASAANATKVEYRLDAAKVSEDTIILTMDFSQNLTLPSVPDTPSGWYFLSLISVSLFGVYCANTQKHHSYIYTERKGGKGANEIASMLHNTLEQQGLLDVEMEQATSDDQGATTRTKTLILWADNCCEQNKNSFVLWYLMFLVQYDIFANVSLKFLVKGHTKNPCDRSFGYVKKHVSKNECWNVKELVDCVGRSSAAIDAINLENKQHPFHDFKSFLSKFYNKVSGIRQYQLFRIGSAKKGFVECRRTPSSEPKLVNLCRHDPDAEFQPLRSTLAAISPLPHRLINPEKVADIHDKILSYVPDEYKDDLLYNAPSEQEVAQARDVKKLRRQAQMKKRRLHEDDGKESTA